jgi:hypothetical protein
MFRPYQVLQIWYRVRFHPRSFKTYMKNWILDSKNLKPIFRPLNYLK